MYDHQDEFSVLNSGLPLPDKIRSVHHLLKQRFPFLDRIAVAVYDAKTDLLKTYVHSSGEDQPLTLHDAVLSDSGSLQEILKKGRPRVLNDLDEFYGTSARITSVRYGASYTLPMYLNDVFFGFLFFNSYQKKVFDDTSLHYLDMLGHLLSLLVIHELSHTRTLLATVRTATDMAQHRDFETGAHLDRMANYARLVAREVAPKFKLSDEIVEHIFLFSPLHDIGKIGIPDTILLKPAKLTDAEFEMMKTHATKGTEIIDRMLENFGLTSLRHVDVLRNIALYHHEALNGSGYPYGLVGEGIPVEAKIVAVADVFDALTSARPYKEAWSNQRAFELLLNLAGEKFDPDCVAALISCREQIEAIQRRFHEDEMG
ncbi:MAG: HD domain-containing protein [Sulfuricella sp.]|nr:HD domain-containing protein [Sulfuricella sp.]